MDATVGALVDRHLTDRFCVRLHELCRYQSGGLGQERHVCLGHVPLLRFRTHSTGGLYPLRLGKFGLFLQLKKSPRMHIEPEMSRKLNPFFFFFSFFFCFLDVDP